MVQYCSVTEFLDYLGLKDNVLDKNRDLELVDDSGSVSSGQRLFLKSNHLISDTLVLSHGTTSGSVTDLTVTTDYSVDVDKGIITLTSAGATAIGTNNVYADYDSISPGLNKTETSISSLIDKQTALIDKITHRTWQPLSLISNELHTGKGDYNLVYRVKSLPLKFVRTTLDADMTTTDLTITLGDTTGLEPGDILSIGLEAVTIVSVDDSTTLTITRASKDTTAIIHVTGESVINMIIEISNSPRGEIPTYTFKTYEDKYSVNGETWSINLLNGNHKYYYQDFVNTDSPRMHDSDRLRITYKSGSLTVDPEICDLCVMLTGKKLFNSQVLNALSRATNGFETSGLDNVDDEIDRIIKRKRVLLGGHD